MGRALFVGLLLIAAAAGAWVLLAPSPSDSAYVTEHADEGPVRSVVETTGRVVALETVVVGAEVSGRLAEVLVEVNDTVVAGQELARFDTAPFLLAVDLAEASVQRTEAQLDQTEALAEAAREDLSRVERDFARIEALAERGVASESALETARSELVQSRSELARLRAQAEGLVAERRQARAQLDQARLDLERATITAPIAGMVVRRDVSPGQTVASAFQTPTLFTLTGDLDSMRVEASVDEADIGAIRAGLGVRFRVPAYRDRWFDGEVQSVVAAPNEDGFLITYPVMIAVADAGGALLPGMTAQVEILADERERALRVPNTALLYRHEVSAPSGGLSVSVVSREEAERLQAGETRRRREAALLESGAPTVWVLRNGRDEPALVEIELGLRGRAHTEVTGGKLHPGDRVVIARRAG